jgi:3-dehydroquinate dehydratase type I
MVEDPDRVLEAMIKADGMGADLVEWRLDVTRDPEVEATLRRAPLPVIATVRSKEQGGSFGGNRDEQLQLLLLAAQLGCLYVDWEFRPGEEMPSELHSMKERVILSYHNFQETPKDLDLEYLFKEMAATGAGVLKIIAKAQRLEDNLSLLGLISHGRQLGIEVVAFCLGPLGKISRVACPLVGGSFTYAALEPGAEAAPGQLTVSEMHQILKLLQ